MSERLAIIIPAYKSLYLKDTLQSFVDQTNKSFVLYIGDDASPNDLFSIINEFQGKLNIVYKRFDENLGGQNLVAHWNRCIKMCQEEEWIWLFSDDDLLTPDCVESFYSQLELFPNEDVFHFEVDIIDGYNQIMPNNYDIFPDKLPSNEYFKRRMKMEIKSFVVEYIVRKTIFYGLGEFEYFDLAWGADDVAWIKFSQNQGIKSIRGAKVNWRLSDSNISSIEENPGIVLRKLDANIAYLLWVDNFFKIKRIEDLTSESDKFRFVFAIIQRASLFNIKQKVQIAFQTLDKLSYNNKYKIILGVIIKDCIRLTKQVVNVK